MQDNWTIPLPSCKVTAEEKLFGVALKGITLKSVEMSVNLVCGY